MGRIANALQSSPAMAFMKTLLMIFNFVFWVSGIAILAVGIWMKLELYLYMELTTVYYSEAPYVLIGVGAGIIVVGMLGCACTAKGNACLLYMFSGFLIVIFLAELCVGVAGFIYRTQLQDGFGVGMTNALNNYANRTEKREAIDGIQRGLKCCGKDSYKDWFAIPWDGKHRTQGVPSSCCRKDGCQNSPLPVNATEAIYTEGCFVKVTSFMEANFGIIGGVTIGFAFLQLFGALLSCCVAKNVNKAKYEQVA